jgi:hypothetical protein
MKPAVVRKDMVSRMTPHERNQRSMSIISL